MSKNYNTYITAASSRDAPQVVAFPAVSNELWVEVSFSTAIYLCDDLAIFSSIFTGFFMYFVVFTASLDYPTSDYFFARQSLMCCV